MTRCATVRAGGLLQASIIIMVTLQCSNQSLFVKPTNP